MRKDPKRRRAVVTGWGHYVPEKVLSNLELEALIDTSDEWIQTRTGIRERRIAGPADSTASMCAAAARNALECSHLTGNDVDLLICATTTPDRLLPATGCMVREYIGAGRAAAFDLNAACSGFLYALAVAAQFIHAGTYERILIVAGETLTRFINWTDRNTCVLFGDGAGAVVLEASDQNAGVLSTVLGCQGDVDDLLTIEPGDGAGSPQTVNPSLGGQQITMRGKGVFRLAVHWLNQVAREALAKARLATSDIDMIIPHQANARILSATLKALGMPADRLYSNVERYGNCGAASIPIALSEFLSDRHVQPGSYLLFSAFGGGMTWGAVVLQWADLAAIMGKRRQAPAASAIA